MADESAALLFDAGVFALVVGATVLMLIAIAHQSLRSARLREHEAEMAEAASDFERLATLDAKLRDAEARQGGLEEAWLEAAE